VAFLFCACSEKGEFRSPQDFDRFAAPEMASYFEDLSASGGLQKSENTSLGQKRPFRESIV